MFPVFVGGYPSSQNRAESPEQGTQYKDCDSATKEFLINQALDQIPYPRRFDFHPARKYIETT